MGEEGGGVEAEAVFAGGVGWGLVVECSGMGERS